MFFQILFDKNEYFEKDLQKEEFNKEIFQKNLQELLDEKENLFQKANEVIIRFRKQNFRLSFLSEKEIFKFIKSYQSPKVIF